MTFIPYVIDKTKSTERVYDIFSRLLEDRIILISGEITDDVSNTVIAELLFLEKESDKDIDIYINSPGGSVSAGLAIYDTMNFIKPNCNTICIGMAASMGAFLLSSGKKRYALENSEIMIHEVRTGFEGNATDIFIHTKWLEKIKNRVDNILAKNTNHSIEDIKKATVFDNFMSALEAKDFGLIDEIITK